MISVACDICSRRYSLGDDRWEQRVVCKDCGIAFEVCEFNKFDPDQPEVTDQPDADEQQPSSFSRFLGVFINVIGATCVVVALVWMIGLLFRDPRQAVAGDGGAGGSTPVAKHREPAPRPALPALPEVKVPEQNPIVVALGRQAAATLDQLAETDTAGEPGEPGGPVAPPVDAGLAPPAGVHGGINYDGPGAIASSGRAIANAQLLQPNQVIQVQWGAAWYSAEVVRVNQSGSVHIHYRGWNSSFDEDVPAARIQLAHD